METVKKATEEDTKGNLEQALPLYQTALEYFLTALKCNYKEQELEESFSCNGEVLPFGMSLLECRELTVLFIVC